MICLPAVTSACIFKDTLRNDTQVLLIFKISIFEICFHPINSNCTPYFLTSPTLTRDAARSKKSRLKKMNYHCPQNQSLSEGIFSQSAATTDDVFFNFSIFSEFYIRLPLYQSIKLTLMYFWEATINRHKPTTKQFSKCSKFDGAVVDPQKRDAVAFLSDIPEPDFVTLDDDSIDPTFPYGFGVQQPIVRRV